VVALVCNFSGSHNPSTVRLNHWELETLFHEFGHALHSLLSRTVIYYFQITNKYISLVFLIIINLSYVLVGLSAFFRYQGGS
jgi:hypothetical protein